MFSLSPGLSPVKHLWNILKVHQEQHVLYYCVCVCMCGFIQLNKALHEKQLVGEITNGGGVIEVKRKDYSNSQ